MPGFHYEKPIKYSNIYAVLLTADTKRTKYEKTNLVLFFALQKNYVNKKIVWSFTKDQYYQRLRGDPIIQI